MGKVISVAMQFKDAFSNPSKKALDNLNKMGRQYQSTGKQIERAGKTITSAGSKLTKSVTAPIAGIAVASIKTAADFEASMSNVAAITGATGKDFDSLNKLAQDLGKSTKYSASEVAQAMQYTGMAGWTAQENMAGLEGILNTAAATGTDLAKTSDIMTDAISAFGNTAKDSGMFADVMTKACTSANVSIDDLGESYKYAGAICGTMGYSIQDATTTLAAMGNQGIKASSAGTTLKNAISNLSAPTKQTKDAMKELGISITNQDGSMKTWGEVVANLQGSFKGLTKDQQSAYAKALFGKQSMAGMLAVINTSEKEYNKLGKAIKNSGGAAETASKKQLDNLNGQITLLKSAVEGAAISIGNKLTPYVKKFTKFVQDLVDKFNNLCGKQQDAIIKFALIAAAIGPAIMIFGKVVSVVGKVHRIFGTITRTISNFGGIMGMLTSPVGIVIAVVAALAVVAVVVIKNWDKVKPALQKVANFLKQVFGPAFGAVGGFIKKNMMPIIKLVIKIVKQMQGVFKAVGKVTSQVFSAMAKLVKKHMKTIQKIISVVTKAITRPFRVAFAIITSVVQAGLKSVSDIIDSLKKVFGGIIDFITNVFTGNWKGAWEAVKNIFSGIFETLGNVLKVPLNAVINIINRVISSINNALGKIKIPKWVPVFGGKKFSFQIPTIPNLSRGTNDWKGGPVQVHERGGEIIDLPKGSRVYPHDQSVKMAKNAGSNNIKIIINKLADTIKVTDEKDIDKMVDIFAEKLKLIFDNM